MESARKTINQFLKSKYSGNELKSELFKAGEAAQMEGWTFMDASFQLGGVARDNGLTADEVAFLEEPYVPHTIVGVMAQNKPADASKEHVWLANARYLKDE